MYRAAFMHNHYPPRPSRADPLPSHLPWSFMKDARSFPSHIRRGHANKSTSTRVHSLIYIYMFVHVRVCMHVSIYMYVCMYACIHIYIYMRMFVYLHICIFVHIHIYGNIWCPLNPTSKPFCIHVCYHMSIHMHAHAWISVYEHD